MPDGRTTPGESITSALDGRWLFTSLEDLDTAIQHWESIRDRILARHHRLRRIIEVNLEPADDVMSRVQAAAFTHSLIALERQSVELHAYADGFAAKLRKARDSYASAEQTIADGLSHG